RIGAILTVFACPAPSSCSNSIIHPIGCIYKGEIHPIGENVCYTTSVWMNERGRCRQEKPMNTLGERLSAVRERRGLTQGERGRRGVAHRGGWRAARACHTGRSAASSGGMGRLWFVTC